MISAFACPPARLEPYILPGQCHEEADIALCSQNDSGLISIFEITYIHCLQLQAACKPWMSVTRSVRSISIMMNITIGTNDYIALTCMQLIDIFAVFIHLS